MKTTKIYFILSLLATILAACTKDNSIAEQQEGDDVPFAFEVVEQPWDGETLLVTRSGETLEGLRATSGDLPDGYGYGFGIYCADLDVENTQVTWDNANGRWAIGGIYNTYWRRNQSGALNIYAYAPYKTTPYTVTGGVLSFNAAKYALPSYTDKLSGDNVDLLYAGRTGYARNSSEPAVLTFRHALAKMTFGTITNDTGGTLSLNGFTLSGTLHSQAKLNLATGIWSEHVSSAAEIQAPPPFIYVTSTPPVGPPPEGYIGFAYIPPLADKETIIPPMPNRELSFIPDANGRITLTIKINSSNVNEEFSFNVILEQGKNKTYNITIGKNYEVVIQE
jgi:hypothetical protein